MLHSCEAYRSKHWISVRPVPTCLEADYFDLVIQHCSLETSLCASSPIMLSCACLVRRRGSPRSRLLPATSRQQASERQPHVGLLQMSMSARTIKCGRVVARWGTPRFSTAVDVTRKCKDQDIRESSVSSTYRHGLFWSLFVDDTDTRNTSIASSTPYMP